ncbi:Peptidoglycan/LPS O-acetylase OafA/YrhL, contains acyltransferase and SGNH-hydrolase domains [Pseudomonas sp. ok272]|uniref:acyltransferase family protein n=1 Tax=unclassified Pseudomonas TaxID=196821 RepID=UPI0008AFBFDA|nr:MULTISPECIES: acyltransferase [unclassified Pseudomonas]SEM87031.1 Peptidoglycan/LPS O-acetylase OafA/YrhL, contains acyltransferase and SGNH-hydrolase domains [Pseudomonas sp. ok272]SFM76888.1 Peptidoglycan/LPS O-acetylase OafA/YrhL, contains acyltransferase and SGNH-hydrolase domains [Pseudomonas sp. ok602]
MSTVLRQFAGFYSKAIAPWAVAQGELLSVQRLRGLAVLMVLLVHVEDIGRKLPVMTDFHSTYALRVGYSAPDLFFVISGFIMTYVSANGTFRPKRWVLSRVFRIVPLYLLFTGLVVLMWLYNPNMTMGSGSHDWASVVKSLLMLPQSGLPILFVGWTLEHEIVFYTLVFLVLRFSTINALPWLMLTLSVLALGKWALRVYGGFDFWDYHLFSLFIIQFTIGVGVFKIYERARAWGVWPPFLAGCGFLLLASIFADSGLLNREQPIRVLSFGLAYGAFMLAGLTLEWQRRSNGYAPKHRDWMVLIGDASYAIYLTHPFVLASFGKLFRVVSVTPLGAAGVVILAGLTTIGVGYAVHVLLEKPVIEIGKRITRAIA